MKLNAAVAKSLLMAALIGMVVPLIAQIPPKTEAPRQPAQPGTPSKAVPTPGPSAEEAEATLPGVVVARPNGGFLSLTVEGGNFRLSFYDAKKKRVIADAVRASVRWKRVTKSETEHGILLPTSDNLALDGNRFVQPPLTFKVFISLLGADDAVIESHVIDFRG